MALIKNVKKLAKFIEYMLAHRPDEFGLVPDADGFVKLKQFLKTITEEPGWRHVRQAHINEILLTLPDPPIEITENQIRAKHRAATVNADSTRKPPKLLYACVRAKAHAFVLEHGLQPGSHPKVILAVDKKMALRIGKRFDRNPLLITVHVQKALAKGITLQPAGQTLFVAEALPADCLLAPPLPKAAPEPHINTPQPKARTPEPGSFILDPERLQQSGRRVPPPSIGGAPNGKNRRKRGRKQRRERPPWRQ